MFEEEEAKRLEPHEYDDDKLRHICSDCLYDVFSMTPHQHVLIHKELKI